jgi:cytochrome-b5 reductase
MPGLLSPQYLHGIYIPSALLIVGVAIIKKDWLPYAVVLAAALGGIKVFRNSMDPRAVLEGLETDSLCSLPQGAQADRIPAIRAAREDNSLTQHSNVRHRLPAPHAPYANLPSYRFKLPKPTDILGLPIGQHISLAANIAGQPKEVVRSYTPISSDEDKGHFDLLIKSYPTGNISKHVASLMVGQTMKVRGPKGAMVYTPNMVRRFGMIAGGTGITPMLQVIKAIIRGRETGDVTEVDLIFANVNREDILLKEDLDALAAKDSRFRVHYVLNNPSEKWDGGVGFVTPDMIKVRCCVFTLHMSLTQSARRSCRRLPTMSRSLFAVPRLWLVL